MISQQIFADKFVGDIYFEDTFLGDILVWDKFWGTRFSRVRTEKHGLRIK